MMVLESSMAGGRREVALAAIALLVLALQVSASLFIRHCLSNCQQILA